MDSVIDRLLGLGKWLVVPVVALLFLQWPLRDLLQAYSREANDLGQILFAFYIALAVTAATRANAHIAVDSLAQRYSDTTRRTLHRLCSGAVLIPWAAFVVWSGRSFVTISLIQFERFQDTGHPGYFLIKIAVLLLAVLVLTAGIVDAVRPTHSRPRS